MSKSTEQQIADLQNRLQSLRTKKARQDKREETRQKIILGAEVAKILNKKPEEINKALLLGLLSNIDRLDEDEKRDCIRKGMNILEEWKKWKPWTVKNQPSGWFFAGRGCQALPGGSWTVSRW